MNTLKINYPIVRADELVVRAFGGIQSIPTSFLIDKEGRVVTKFEKLVSKEVYVENLNKILNNKYETTFPMGSPSFSLTLIEPK